MNEQGGIMTKITSYQEYLEAHSEWQTELSVLDALISKTELERTIKWAAPVYTLSGKNVVGLGAFKSYVGLWFFNGALLTDKNKLLHNAQEGKTKAMRQWRFSSLEDMDEVKILLYLEEAIANQKAGKVVKPTKSSTKFILPEELKNLFDERKELFEKFQSLTQYKQKEYADHIGSAKKESTRQSRLEKAIPLIENGVGLHDKYRDC